MPLVGHLTVTTTDEAVEFVFGVENAGPDPVELECRSGQIADLVVEEDGVDVWRWSTGKMFSQAIRTEALGPDDTLTQEMTWAEPPPGQYTAEGSLEAANVDVVDRAAFEVQ